MLKFPRQRSLSDCVSPLSWLFIYLGFAPPIILLLRPSLLEFFVMMAVDALSYAVFRAIDRRGFLWLYPESASFFPELDFSQIQHFGTSQKKTLLESFSRFPARRAKFLCGGSFLRALPALLIVIFFWKHSISNQEQALMMLGIMAVNLCYFYGASFLDSHIFLSRKIRELHERFDFSEAFELLKGQEQFKNHEIISLISIAFFTLSLQIMTLHSNLFTERTPTLLAMTLIAALGAALFGRIWYLARSSFIQALMELFHQMDRMDFNGDLVTLPSHTSPLLAKFESSYNLLSKRLKLSQRELALVVIEESEKNRYKQLGEMSALIAHDLSGPLHAASYVLNELTESPDSPRRGLYLEKLSANFNRIQQLVTSLKTHGKNPSIAHSETNFMEAHQNVMKLLELQFGPEDFKKARFTCSPELASLTVKIAPLDLVHILDNLYRNSLENLFSHRTHDPQIQVRLQALNPFFIELTISDNGTGLSAAEFEKFISNDQNGVDLKSGSKRGLGLRLTRRLIENHGGQLSIVDQNRPGTSFWLMMPLAQSTGLTRNTPLEHWSEVLP